MVSGDDFLYGCEKILPEAYRGYDKISLFNRKTEGLFIAADGGSQDGAPGSWSGDGVKKVGCRRAEGMWEPGFPAAYGGMGLFEKGAADA